MQRVGCRPAPPASASGPAGGWLLYGAAVVAGLFVAPASSVHLVRTGSIGDAEPGRRLPAVVSIDLTHYRPGGTVLNFVMLPTRNLGTPLLRAKIPGGWLLASSSPEGKTVVRVLTFVPDPDHAWDGTSLP